MFLICWNCREKSYTSSAHICGEKEPPLILFFRFFGPAWQKQYHSISNSCFLLSGCRRLLKCRQMDYFCSGLTFPTDAEKYSLDKYRPENDKYTQKGDLFIALFNMASRSASKRHLKHFVFLSNSTWTQRGARGHKGAIDWVQQAVFSRCGCQNAAVPWQPAASYGTKIHLFLKVKTLLCLSFFLFFLFQSFDCPSLGDSFWTSPCSTASVMQTAWQQRVY